MPLWDGDGSVVGGQGTGLAIRRLPFSSPTSTDAVDASCLKQNTSRWPQELFFVVEWIVDQFFFFTPDSLHDKNLPIYPGLRRELRSYSGAHYVMHTKRIWQEPKCVSNPFSKGSKPVCASAIDSGYIGDRGCYVGPGPRQYLKKKVHSVAITVSSGARADGKCAGRVSDGE